MYDESRDKIVVKPGRYFVGLRLLDLNTNTTSSKEIEYSFKDFFRDSVSISDVVVVDSSGAIPVQFVRGNSTSAGLYVVSKIVPADIPLHVIVKSTRAPTSIDTLYSLKQISRVQYYRLPLNVSGLDAVTYNLRVSAGDESSETAFTKFPNGQPATHAESGSETGPLAYVMTHQQFDSLRSATEQEGEKIKRGFWLERSHGDTAISEAMEREFYKRVDAVDEQFGTTFISGWRTDRGRIYILYGKPDRIENHINSLNAGRAENSSPYEVWYYTSLKLRFTFTDEFRDGNYRLVKTDGT
jgi:GWxTD domain-containing protein